MIKKIKIEHDMFLSITNNINISVMKMLQQLDKKYLVMKLSFFDDTFMTHQ